MIRALLSAKRLNPAASLPSGFHDGDDEQNEGTEKIDHFVDGGLEKLVALVLVPGLDLVLRRRDFLLSNSREPKNLLEYKFVKRKM